MRNNLHHTHLFASDIKASIAFYTEGLDGVVVLDDEVAGVRNVFIRIGSGRLHLYDQPSKSPGRGSIHHLGIQTDDITGVADRLQSRGVPLRKGITSHGFWRYLMVPAPDGVLIELFEVDVESLPKALRSYFE